jgi:hypothetical protein
LDNHGAKFLSIMVAVCTILSSVDQLLQMEFVSCTLVLLFSCMFWDVMKGCDFDYAVTPLDVVKIRLQAQHKPFRSGSCFVYSNGLMDCLCVCSHCNETNGSSSDVKHAQRAAAMSRLRPWYERPGQFTGTLVCTDGHFSGTRVCIEC